MRSLLARMSERFPTHWLRQVVCRLVLATVATLLAARPGHAITTYSGASMGSTGAIHGWGVTDATQGGMTHTAHVSTTLRSPQGRTSSSGTLTGTNTVRADVYLPWSSTDLGTYTSTSNHDYWCPAILATIFLAATQAFTTVYDFAVSLSPTTVQPDGIGGSATTTVTVQTTPPVSGRSVTLQDVRVANTGGHPANHPLPNSAVTGTFTPSASGTTDANGRLQRTYRATIFGGRQEIKATISDKTRSAIVDVKVSGLGQLTPGTHYYNNNSAPGQIAHPDNWWGTTATRNGLVVAANACPSDPQCNLTQLPYNDISLPWGGKFDGNSYNWTGGHAEHKVGTSADVNSCNFDALVQARIEFLLVFTGGAISSVDECSTPYHTFHFRW
jgi:hypothetical protein